MEVNKMELARDIRALVADLNYKVSEAAACGISTEYYIDGLKAAKMNDGPYDGTQIAYQKLTPHLVIPL